MLGVFHGKVFADEFGESFWDAFREFMDEATQVAGWLRPGQFFRMLFNFLLPLAIIVAVAIIGISGYGLMTSEGDPRKVQTSKDNLFSAIMGLVFVLLAIVIYRVIVTGLLGEDFP